MTAPHRRTPVLTLALLAIGACVFVGVTAAEGAGTLNVPLSIGDVIVGVAVTLFGFFGKRVLAKLDYLTTKTDRIDVALCGYNGEGGVIQDVRDLQSAVYRDDGQAPRGMAPPAGFNVMTAAAKREPT